MCYTFFCVCGYSSISKKVEDSKLCSTFECFPLWPELFDAPNRGLLFLVLVLFRLTGEFTDLWLFFSSLRSYTVADTGIQLYIVFNFRYVYPLFIFRIVVGVHTKHGNMVTIISWCFGFHKKKFDWLIQDLRTCMRTYDLVQQFLFLFKLVLCSRPKK